MNNLTNLLATGCSEAHILTRLIGRNCRITCGEASKSAECVVSLRKEEVSSGGDHNLAVRKPMSGRCRLAWYLI